ncbi:hypothetical protein HY638_01130 [Candidatus Woesearchaeota archaeon]|nr:hypothetical protein [Candidatus Woesearchaeota archaeon]
MVGNIPNYSALDLVRSMFYLEEPVSRLELSRSLELGEGTVRTILDGLKGNGLIASTQEGHFLSGKGKNLMEKIGLMMGQPKSVRLGIFPKLKEKGCIIRKKSRNVPDYKVRDIAVKNGAEGALILSYGSRLEIPCYSRADFSFLGNEFNLQRNDTLVVAFAGNSRDAENACISCALYLTNLQKVLNGRLKSKII